MEVGEWAARLVEQIRVCGPEGERVRRGRKDLAIMIQSLVFFLLLWGRGVLVPGT